MNSIDNVTEVRPNSFQCMRPFLAQRGYHYCKIKIYEWIRNNPELGRALFLPASVASAGTSLVFGIAHTIESFAYVLINLAGAPLGCKGCSWTKLTTSASELFIGAPLILLSSPVTLVKGCALLLVKPHAYAADRVQYHQDIAKNDRLLLESDLNP